MSIELKRAYQAAEPGDGYRVLVDRVWPRGISRADAKIDKWLKSAAPSTELRKWFGHDPNKFIEFKQRYKHELSGSKTIQELKDTYKQHKKLTLVYGAKNEKHNNAVVLKQILVG